MKNVRNVFVSGPESTFAPSPQCNLSDCVADNMMHDGQLLKSNMIPFSFLLMKMKYPQTFEKSVVIKKQRHRANAPLYFALRTEDTATITPVTIELYKKGTCRLIGLSTIPAECQ